MAISGILQRIYFFYDGIYNMHENAHKTFLDKNTACTTLYTIRHTSHDCGRTRKATYTVKQHITDLLVNYKNYDFKKYLIKKS